MPCIFFKNVSVHQVWKIGLLTKFMEAAKIICGAYPEIFLSEETTHSVGWSEGRTQDFKASVTSLVHIKVVWHEREEIVCKQMAVLIHKLLVDHGYRDTDITFDNMPEESFYINGKLVK